MGKLTLNALRGHHMELLYGNYQGFIEAMTAAYSVKVDAEVSGRCEVRRDIGELVGLYNDGRLRSRFG